MEFTDKFQKLVTKLILNLNCDKKHNQENDVNILLNELNSLDYEKNKLTDSKAAICLILSFINIPANEEILIMKSCCLITVLINKQKLQLTSEQFNNVLRWLIKCLQFNICGSKEILSAMQVLFKNHPQYCANYWDQFMSCDGIFSNLMNESDFNINDYKKIDENSFEEILASTIICIESLILCNSEISENDCELLARMGSQIMNLIYKNKIKIENTHGIVAITASLNILNKIASENTDWSEQYLGKLIGIAKTFMHFGLPGINELIPQKVLTSQQSVFESNSLNSEQNRGGKVPKTRKLRTVSKIKKQDHKTKSKTSNDVATGSRIQGQIPLESQFEIECTTLCSFNKTSDSDFSESETGRAQNEKSKKSKMRLAAISLIGVLAKNTDRKIFYGFWHALLPSQPSDRLSSGLLYTVSNDSNARCRIQALQVACIMFYGSKAYLLQAENTEHPPTSFMPFSISLGNMIILIYEILTQTLAVENSLPVLTQLLKCLTVLIQATPFTRLKTGFVKNFVKYVQKLVYHKDPTIQVAALMVMEFLISSQELTPEISECLGVPKGKCKNLRERNENKLYDSGVKEIDDTVIDSDFEELESPHDKANVPNNSIAETVQNNLIEETTSWLLQKILENLDHKMKMSSIPVQIESLNVLTSMAPQFLMCKPHLLRIGAVLEISLNRDQLEIVINSGKCLDAFGHAINTFLLENPDNDEITKCQVFWSTVLPSVILKIQDPIQNPALKGLKSILCDFLSNIGVHIFERLSHNQQMQLVSLLSGISCNDENTVRASAVRALAIYVFFPSLREDLCFVENISESILKLMKDTNSFVRVKCSWSLGNVSDALLTNCVDSQFDRVCDDLLKRLLEATIDSANYNDKVKCNAVRTIGNLLRLITTDQLKFPQWRTVCLKAIETLVNCMQSGGNAKVKWNSCYAVGNFMKNKSLFTVNYSDFNWQKLVFPSVCDIIKTSINFKVRINGAAALIVINDRKYYGSYFIPIWCSLLAAVEQSDNLTDFNEYKHRDNLQEQLCQCISHMIKIAAKDDFSLLNNELRNSDTIKQLWIRVTNRIIPENAAPLIDCCIHLKKLLNDESLSTEQKNAVQHISNFFTSPVQHFF